MARAFKLPDLGEGIHEGEVVSVLVAVGDRVLEGQPILEVETDKARVEIPSPYSGTVQEIKVKPGDIVKVGTVLILFSDREEARPAVPLEKVKPEPAPPPETAPAAAPEVAAAAPAAVAAAPAAEAPVPASPATRRLARELGVDLHQVTGSGPHGLVTAEDIKAFVEARAKAAEIPRPPAPELPPKPVATAPPPPLPDFTRWGSVERIPLRSVRRATTRRLSLAWSQVPHVSHQDVVDITKLEEFRHRHKDAAEARGGKLTLTVFVLKAAVAALKKYPYANASLDTEAEEIILKRHYHLGVAVDTERGLMVPVVRDVDRKSIIELAVELHGLAERTRAGTVTPEDLQGGTFTVTNIGAVGGTGFAPLVNYPQVAILGAGRARLQPVVLGTATDYQIVPRLMLPLVLAFDHRVLDGADAARFVNLVIELLEDPEQLLLALG